MANAIVVGVYAHAGSQLDHGLATKILPEPVFEV
jgi:hypothetical protein